MNYYPLLVVLPPELIHIIYLIILREDKANKISTFYKLRLNKICVMLDVINSINNIHWNTNSDSGKMIGIVSDMHISNLQFILDNDFSRILCPHHFWQNLTSVMSDVLMNIHNKLLLNIISKSHYKNLCIAIQIWFKLCKKHNIKLCLFYLNFKMVVLQNNQWIDKNYARRYLKSFTQRY